MKLNTDIWGTQHGKFWYADLTYGPLTNYINNGNSFFTSTFEQLTYNGETYSNGQLSKMAQLHPEQYNTLIDNSICYAAIPANSPLATVSYLNRTANLAGRYEAYHGDIPLFLAIAFNGHDTNANSSMGCTGSGNGYLPNRWSQWTAEDISEWDTQTEYPTGGRFIMPITKYNYNDIVLVIKVIVGNDLANPQNYSTLDLADWEANKAANPYLYCCYGIPYIGKAGSRFNINNNVSMAYTGFGTDTTRSNYLRVVKNIPMATLPDYHNNDVNDYDQSTPLINYNSERWLNARGSGNNRYVGTYGLSVGVGNSSITPNTSLDSFKATGSIDGDSGIYIFTGDDTIIQSYPFTNSSRVVTRLKDDVDVRKLMSWYGLQFVDSTSKIQAEIGSNDLCIPIIGADGYTTGEYKSGAESLELPNSDWGEDFHDKNGYDGRPNEPFNMETELRPQNSAAASPFTYQYVLNSTKVSQLKDYLYTTIASSTDETRLFEQFLTNNPIDCIASLVVFPFNVENYVDGVAGEHVIMGNVDTGIVATGLYRGMVIVLDGGSVKYRDYFGDFRSYEPYSDAELHIPYHGNVHITPSEYVDHIISVKYLVDICSGASIALVYRDGLVIDSITGQIGGTLRLTGIQTASYHNAVYNAASGYKQAKTSQAVQGASAVLGVLGSVGNAISQKDLGGVLSSITSGIGGAAQAAINTENKEYNLNHIQVPYKSIGANTTFTSMGNEQYCRLIIKRPVMLQYSSDSYGHTTGYATIETAKLSNYTGYTKISAADLSGIPCTAQERADILRLLQSGVYL